LKELRKLFPDCVGYAKDGRFYLCDGKEVGESFPYYAFPKEYELLEEEKAEFLKKAGISRLLTESKLVVKSTDGYRVYDLAKVKVIDTFSRLERMREAVEEAIQLE